MTNASQGVNGCSLEDCHTNLFSLTDLNEIQWYTYRTTADTPSDISDPLDDPVLLSYTKCLSADILVVWKRFKRPTGGPPSHHHTNHHHHQHSTSDPSSPSYGKELWVFWYKTEPVNLQNLVSKKLERNDNGSWKDGQLTYECRTLLFKALHNLIEKCLLGHNFVRVGKWFVQPVTSPGDRSGHLSFAFNFFLHGESTVCASIDVRQHHPLLTLTPQHLVDANGGVKRKDERSSHSSKSRTHSSPPLAASRGVEVVLSPYGLRGTLTGRAVKDADAAATQCLEEWRHFYPVRTPDDVHFSDGVGGGVAGVWTSGGAGGVAATAASGRVPAVVEVVVGGARMKYPSCHVLVPAKADNPLDCVGGSVPRVVSSSTETTVSMQENKSIVASASVASSATRAPGSRVSQKLQQQQHGLNQNSCYALTPPTSPPDHADVKGTAKHDDEVQTLTIPTLSDFLGETAIRASPSSDSLGRRLLQNVEKDRNISTTSALPASGAVASATSSTALRTRSPTPVEVDGKTKTETTTTTTTVTNVEKLSMWPFSNPADRRSCACVSGIKTRVNSCGAVLTSGSSGGGGKANTGVGKLTPPSSRTLTPGTGNSTSGFSGTNAGTNAAVWGESIRKHLGGGTSDNDFSNASKTKEKPSSLKTRKFGGSFHRRSMASLDAPKFQPDPFLAASGDNFITFRTSVSGISAGYTGRIGAEGVLLKTEGAIENVGASPSPFRAATPSPLVTTDPLLQPLTINAAAANAVTCGPSSLTGVTTSFASAPALGSGGQPPSDPAMPTLSPHPPQLKKEDTTSVNMGCSTASVLPTTTAVSTSILSVGHQRHLYVGPVAETEATDCKATRFCRDVSDHAQQLVRSLKRPRLRASIREEEASRLAEADRTINFPSLYADNQAAHRSFRATWSKDSTSTLEGVRVKAESPWEVAGPKVGVKRIKGEPRPSHDPYEFGSDDDDEAAAAREASFGPEEKKQKVEPTSTVSPEKEVKETKDANAAAAAAKSAAAFLKPGDLEASLADLDQLFDTDSDTEDDPSASLSTKTSKNPVAASSSKDCGPELSNIYPTPPSADHNKDEPEADADHTTSIDGVLAGAPALQHPPALAVVKLESTTGGLVERAAEKMDWSQIWLPPSVAPFRGSNKYAPVTNLPSLRLPPLDIGVSYKRSTGASYSMVPVEAKPLLGLADEAFGTGRGVREHRPNASQPAPLDSSVNSPASFALGGGPRGGLDTPGLPRTPLSHAGPASYEPLPSPASNASSAYHGGGGGPKATANAAAAASAASSAASANNSADQRPSSDSSASATSYPEANSLVVNIALSDTLLNLFKDHNFDSCNICVCNTDLKGLDVEVVLPDSSGDSQFRCTCGFSAVRNRYLGYNAGLFWEDERDLLALGGARFVRPSSRYLHKPSLSLPNASATAAAAVNSFPVNTDTPISVLELLIEQFTVPFPSPVLRRHFSTTKPWTSRTRAAIESAIELELCDGDDVGRAAMGVGCRAAAETAPPHRRADYLDSVATSATASSVVHRWAYESGVNQSRVNSADAVRLLRSLQPFLQDAIQSKRHTNLWDVVYNVTGPLTWNEFHKMAGRGTDEQCEPQPIPSVLVGYAVGSDPLANEKEWLSLSPFAVAAWEKLMLEPYSKSRNVAYVVVAPDNDFLLSRARTFFSELSATYETLRFGLHRPLTDKLRDGVMRVSRKRAASGGGVKSGASDPDTNSAMPSKWFDLIGDSPVARQLRLYATICVKILAPFLVKTLTARGDEATQSGKGEGASPPRDPASADAIHPGSMQPPPPPDGVYIKKEDPSSSTSTSDHQHHHQHNGISSSSSSAPATCVSSYRTHPTKYEFETEPPVVVVYVVDPFQHHEEWTESCRRLATIGLFRCFTEMLSAMEGKVPEKLRKRFHLELVPLETIVDGGDESGAPQLGRLKAFAFSVFSQCRRILDFKPPYKSLTGLGPCAEDVSLLKKLSSSRLDPLVHRLFSPPFVLDAPKPRHALVGDFVGESATGSASKMPNSSSSSPPFSKSSADRGSATLFCAYCLSEDQRLLLAAFTDDRGELLQTRCINVEIPDRARRKKASARKIGLQRLFDACVAVMAASTGGWRLVVGRFGRLGHGELKGWNALLGKKSLLAACAQLREACPTCQPPSAAISSSSSTSSNTYVGGPDHPTILSACLVSLVADTSLTVMTDAVCAYGANETRRVDEALGRMHTPKDASQTHILVFPTSATAHSNQPGKPETDNIDIFLGVGGIDDDPCGMFDEIFDDELFGVSELDKSAMQRPDSPQGNSRTAGTGAGGSVSASSHPTSSEEHAPPSLQNQPLALGYYVSSAKTSPLPYWFWSKAPKYENACPSFFKAALHIHSPAVQLSSADGDRDDLIQAPTSVSRDSAVRPSHPLDSTTTCDVLRHVLERYNALSWLTLDPAVGDRRSCLPVHLLVLMQLSETVSTFL